MKTLGDSLYARNDILSEKEDGFLCVCRKDIPLCREAESLLSQRSIPCSLLDRAVALVGEYENALNECDDLLIYEIFDELFTVREEIAICEGYGNYGEYIFQRDIKFSRDKLVAVIDSICAMIPDDKVIDKQISDYVRADSPKDSFEKISTVISDIPGLGEFLRMLTDMGRINIYSDSDFTSYDENGSLPMINIALRGDMTDMSRFAHELGHAYGIFLAQKTPDLITSEIHACLTEFIIHPYLQSRFEDLGEKYRSYHTASKLRSLFYSCAVTEFELTLYGQRLKAENAGIIWQRIVKKYGFTESDTAWVKYGHLFRFPFYNVSYIISILYTLREYKCLSIDKYERLMRKGFSYEDLSQI